MRKKVCDKIIELLPTIWEGIKFAKTSDSAQDSTAILCNCFIAVQSIQENLKSGLSAERFEFYKAMIDTLKALIENLNDCICNAQPVIETSHKLKDTINKIKYELSNEEEVKIEILFLPYKSSMWDSLESIWRTAFADPKCICSVVPIPYFAADGNGQFTKFNYEFAQFPSEVNAIRYDKYDIAARHPDIIYFHNPYDNYNTLTQVPPQYFSSELKKHTDCLVYSPYFILSDYDITGKENHFFMQIGAINADYIITQSELFKNRYIELGFSPDKLICYGSPKIDSVIYHAEHSCCIPNEWKTKIDGKKVLLINTSIFILGSPDKLDDSRDMLNYLIGVFRILLSNPDIAVIWRPHPLALDGIKRYYPSFETQYLKLVEEIKNHGHAVYDTSPSYINAFSVSDAFITSPSSLVPNYLALNKPIYLFGEYDLYKDDKLRKGIPNIETYYTQCKNGQLELLTKDWDRNSSFKNDYFNIKSKYYCEDSDYYKIYSNLFPNQIVNSFIHDWDMQFLIFRDMMLSGEDPLKKSRTKQAQIAIPNLDGKAGEKIHKFILKKFNI